MTTQQKEAIQVLIDFVPFGNFSYSYLSNSEEVVEKEDFDKYSQWIWDAYQSSKSEFRSPIPPNMKLLLCVSLYNQTEI